MKARASSRAIRASRSSKCFGLDVHASSLRGEVNRAVENPACLLPCDKIVGGRRKFAMHTPWDKHLQLFAGHCGHFCGYAAAYRGVLLEDNVAALNRFVFSLSAPALCFAMLP